MEQVIFRMNKNDKKKLKVKLALNGISLQDYLIQLIKLDQEKDLIKSIS